MIEEELYGEWLLGSKSAPAKAQITWRLSDGGTNLRSGSKEMKTDPARLVAGLVEVFRLG